MRHCLLPLICIVALAGCDRQKEQRTVTIPGDGGTVTVSGNGQHMTVRDANGSQRVEIDTNAVTAAVLPNFVPLYPGAKITSSVIGAGEKGTGGTVTIQTSATPADLVAYYKQKTSASGFSETMNMVAGGTTMFAATSGDKAKAIQVIASASNGTTHAQVTWSGN